MEDNVRNSEIESKRLSIIHRLKIIIFVWLALTGVTILLDILGLTLGQSDPYSVTKSCISLIIYFVFGLRIINGAKSFVYVNLVFGILNLIMFILSLSIISDTSLFTGYQLIYNSSLFTCSIAQVAASLIILVSKDFTAYFTEKRTKRFDTSTLRKI